MPVNNKNEYFEVVARCTWADADQQDSLLQSCISWAEQSRFSWYREFSRRHNGKAPQHVPRMNRVFLRQKEESEWPSQGDIVRAKTWIATIGNRSFEMHSDIVIVRWDADDEKYEVPVARVQTVRVFIEPLSDLTKSILLDHVMEEPTTGEVSWKPYQDKPALVDLHTVRLFTRISDVDAVQHVNNAVYPKLLMNAFWSDTNEAVKYVKRMDIEYIAEVPAGIEVELVVCGSESGDESVRFVLLREVATGLLLNRSRWEFNLESSGAVRYNRTRPGRMSTSLVEFAMTHLDTPGPFRSQLTVAWEETSTASAFAVSMLKWGDAAIMGLWCMMGMKSFIPPKDLFGKKVIVMQRSTTGRIFRRPIGGTVLVSEAWISKTGTSSMEFYCQFLERGTHDVLFAMKITKVVVDLKTGKKADKLFFDTKHFENLYAGLKCVDIPDPKSKAPTVRDDSSLAFSYRPLLRHQDQDTLGHLNSYLYMAHVHDARDAWIRSQQSSCGARTHHPLTDRERTFVSDSWLDSFGIDFMGENKKGENLVIRHYRPSNREDPSVSWFMFDEAEGRTRTRIWTRARTAEDGFTPFMLNKPSFYQQDLGRVEGVDENANRVVEKPEATTRLAVPTVQTTSTSTSPAALSSRL